MHLSFLQRYIDEGYRFVNASNFDLLFNCREEKGVMLNTTGSMALFHLITLCQLKIGFAITQNGGKYDDIWILDYFVCYECIFLEEFLHCQILDIFLDNLI